MNLMVKELIAQGMAYHDIMEADYYHLMEILCAKPVEKQKVMDLADFIKKLP